MRALRFLVLSGGFATALLHGGTALACGASPTPYYDIVPGGPKGDMTPRNAPLVVDLKANANGPVDAGFFPTLTLTKVGSDVAIELKSHGMVPPRLTWIPIEPLEPETTYQADFNSGYEGVPDTIWTFTTGRESAPPLSLEGQLEVAFEPGTDTVETCPPPNPCGYDLSKCTTQIVQVTKARVKIPHAIGGFPGRTGELWLTDDLPYDFSPESKTAPPPYAGQNISVVERVDLDDPSVQDVLITVPDPSVAYRPCFAFAASDGRGDQATTQPLCLETPIMPADGFDAASDDDTQNPRTSKGCSFRPESGSNSSSAWLAALSLLVLLRRRTA
jgi:MYXO-CTERM domain-containing protein